MISSDKLIDIKCSLRLMIRVQEPSNRGFPEGSVKIELRKPMKKSHLPIIQYSRSGRLGKVMMEKMHHALYTVTRATHKTLEISPIHMDYIHIENKSAQTLVFLHGFSDRPETFLIVAKALKENFNILIPYLPGFDNKGLHSEIFYNPQFYTHCLKRLLIRENINKIHLSGLSMGGALALNFYETHPSLVDSLCLINSSGLELDGVQTVYKNFHEGKKLFIVNHYDDFLYLLNHIFFKTPYMPLPIRNWLYEDYRRNAQVFNELFVQLSSFQEKLIGKDSVMDLNTIDIPTLIVWGKEDQLIPYSIGKEFHRRIRYSHFNTIEKTGHCAHMENPFQLVKYMKTFYSTFHI